MYLTFRTLFLIFMVIFAVQNCFANFNLFVTKSEVKKLLGLNAELYYVREGVVNEYAMSWTVKVLPEIHSIYFNWDAMSKRKVLYNIAVWTNKSSLSEGSANPILEPTVNVSLAGVIPKKVGVFQLNLPCTGLVTGEVEVILNLNVTSPRANQKPVVLYFSRKKICLKGVAASENYLPHKDTTDVVQTDHDYSEEEEEIGLPVFAYVISGVASVALVVGLITAVACWKRNRFSRKSKCSFASAHPPLFIASNSVQVKSTDSVPKSSFCQFDSSYTGPSGGTYTAPSVATGNSYASVYKFPFQSTDTKENTAVTATPTYKYSDHSSTVIPYKYSTSSNIAPYKYPDTVNAGPYKYPDTVNAGPYMYTDSANAVPYKYSDSTCSGNYESSCYSICNYNCDTNESSSNSKSKSSSYFGSKDSKESDQLGGGRHQQSLRYKPDTNFDRLTSSLKFDCSTLKDRFKKLHMERERVRLTEVIQEGSIGRIYRGWLQREHPELDQQVLIKTLKDGSSTKEVENMCEEGSLIFNLRHQNLMSLVGMSFAPKTPPFLIFPDPGGVNLRIYLQSKSPLKVLELVEIYLQIARGLHFMHANNIMHTDVAARNCIISENLHLRLTDNSLSRDFFPEDYEGEGFTPVRWRAPEAFEDIDSFSTHSDMWSFGVLLWELSVPNERPYESLHYKQLRELLQEGVRLRQIFSCPDELYQLMTACWTLCPERRPSAYKASEFLTSFKRSLQSFV